MHRMTSVFAGLLLFSCVYFGGSSRNTVESQELFYIGVFTKTEEEESIVIGFKMGDANQVPQYEVYQPPDRSNLVLYFPRGSIKPNATGFTPLAHTTMLIKSIVVDAESRCIQITPAIDWVRFVIIEGVDVIIVRLIATERT